MKSKPVEPVAVIGTMPVFLATQRPNRDDPDLLIVSFRCPCGRLHEHRWRKSDNPARPQHRAAHCHGGALQADGYFIVLERDATVGTPTPRACKGSRAREAGARENSEGGNGH